MTTIRIPHAEELADRLSGVNRLLVARGWERAAIVFAFTEVGEIGAGRWRKPEPPKMHIREFAAQGYAGLTTNKAVSRYRDAWLSAIGNGWAVPVEPGQEVTLPDVEFPTWPYGDSDREGTVTITEQDEDEPTNIDNYREGRSYNRRSMEERVLASLDSAVKGIATLAENVDTLDESMRQELLHKASELRRQTNDLLRKLGGLSRVK